MSCSQTSNLGGGEQCDSYLDGVSIDYNSQAEAVV